MQSEVSHLARLLREHQPALALTGAGLSTESGIPDFRTPETGLYARYDPIEYLSVWALQARPQVFWEFFAEHYGLLETAQPNRGHLALAQLEAAGYLTAVVTQNIDGLHQKAGARRVLEVHGHLRTVRCSGCPAHYPLALALEQVQVGSLPTCPNCGRRLRPNVVLFGDMMPPAFTEASSLVRESALLLVVGSSLAVSPVNCLAWEAPRLAIINWEMTAADSAADLVLRGKGGESLRALVEELEIP